MPATEIKKRTQPSRKGKKAWRKNIDIEDVEENQESLRVEERVRGTTGPTSIESLFEIDTAGDAQTRQKLAHNKPLRMNEILKNQSAAPGVNQFKSSPNKASKHESKKIEKIAKKREQRTDAMPPAKKPTPGRYDLWATDEPIVALPKAPSTLSQKPMAALHQSPIAVPHPGASYNPSQDDHQNLLRQAHAIEVEKEAAIAKLNGQLLSRDALGAISDEVEASGEEESEEEDSADGDDTVATKPKVKERKTRTMRNKQKRKKADRNKQRALINEKELLKQIEESQEIIAELEARQSELAGLLEKKKTKKQNDEKNGLVRLGKQKIKEMPVEIQLQDELSESLRQLKPEGNLLLDRYTSLQKRNIIEPRAPAKRQRKYKLKVYEQPSYKAWDANEARKEKARR